MDYATAFVSVRMQPSPTLKTFYGFQYHKTYDHIKSQLPANVHLLENECYELDGVLFIGATLWTDMNKGDELTLFHMKSMMNDYRQVTMFNEAKNAYHRLAPEKTMADHYRSRAYIKQVLEENRANGRRLPVVVMTHHAPSKVSIKPRYLNDTIMNDTIHAVVCACILHDNSHTTHDTLQSLPRWC